MTRGRMVPLGVAAALAAGTLAACSGPGRSLGPPTAAADRFAAAWSAGTPTAAAAATDRPVAARAELAAVAEQLPLAGLRVAVAGVRWRGAGATARYRAVARLAGLGAWTWTGSWPLRRVAGHWLVHWSDADLEPRLRAGLHLAVSRALPARAPLLDGRGAPLFVPQQVVTVSLLPSGVRDPAHVVAVLAHALGLDAAALHRQLAAAPRNQLLAVESLRWSAYLAVRPVIHPLPGVYFPVSTEPLAPTPEFARALLGRVGPATAATLAAAGPAYRPGDSLGLWGLQQAYQSRLAGTATGSVQLLDRGGGRVAVLARFAGRPPRPVATTLDRSVQAAAEAALAPLGPAAAAALVVVRASDGAVLADADLPADSSFDRGLVGEYPPGSTFKVVTATALLAAGLTPATPQPCPPTVTVDGKVFHNFAGEAAAGATFGEDFARSCNTAFVEMAGRLGFGALPAAARRYGIGGTWRLPVPAFTGSVPVPRTALDRAAAAIGQGADLVSPLDLALAAAAVDAGAWHPPVLVTDPTPPAGPAPVPVAEPAPLRAMMRSVVTSGTAAGAFAGYAGPPVFGKTGTAEFGSGPNPPTHAWFIGYRGNLAFAVVVEGGGVGGAVAAPVARRLLDRLGPGAGG